MEIYNPTAARENLYGLIEGVNKSREPIAITGKKGDAVLLSRKDYQDMEETIFLLNAGMGPVLRDALREEATTDKLEW